MEIGKIVNIKEGGIKISAVILSFINSVLLTLGSAYLLILFNIKSFKVFKEADFFSDLIYYNFIDVPYIKWIAPVILIIINTLYVSKLIYNSLYKYCSLNSYVKITKLIPSILLSNIIVAFKAIWVYIIYMIFLPIITDIFGSTTVIDSITFYIFCWSWMLPILSIYVFRIVFDDTERRYNPNYDKSIKKNYEKKCNKVKKKTKQEVEKETHIYKEKYEKYNSNKFIDKLNNENKKYPYSYIFENKNNEYKFSRNKRYIKSYINDEKYFALDNNIKMLKNKYKVDDILEIKDKILSNIDTLISKNNNNLYALDNLYSKSEKSNKLCIYENLKDIAKDTSYLLNNRLNYLKNEYMSAKLGYEGELRVNKEIFKYSDEFINIKNKTFNLSKIKGFDEDYTMECDNIIISRNGVFVIETKNKGEFSVVKNSKNRLESKYKLLIEEEGRWVNVYPDGTKEVWQNDPIYQNRNHVLKVRKIINDKLGLTMDDEGYVDVKSIIVIANENLEIDNRTNHSICRVQAIYSEITEKHSKIFNAEQMNRIKDVLDSFDVKDHPPVKYEAINVYEEIVDLEKSLNNYIKKHNIEEYFSKLNKVLQKYHDSIKAIDNDRDKQESKKNHNILFKFSTRRITGCIIFILISMLLAVIPLKYLNNKYSLSYNDSKIEITDGIKGNEFYSLDKLSNYASQKSKWFKYNMALLGLEYEERIESDSYTLSFRYEDSYGYTRYSDVISFSIKNENGKIEEDVIIKSNFTSELDSDREDNTKSIEDYVSDGYLKFIYDYIVKFENYGNTYLKFEKDVKEAYNNTSNNNTLYCGNINVLLLNHGIEAKMFDLIHTIK